MAGDWIKMRADLFTHPKVVRISSALKADTLRTVGGLMSVWCLFDAHSEDGKLDGYTPATLDDHLRWPGFAEAMIAVHWLQADCDETGESLALPEFDTHNGQSAKRRAQDADRKKSVRKMSAFDADKKRTREEKRREEKDQEILSSGDDGLPAEQEQTPKPKTPAIPYDDILAAYHDALPMLPAVRLLTDGRRKKIKARWHELAERQSLDYWRGFFEYAAKSDFLTGRNGKWTSCNFDWLIEPSNHLKVVEGNYENQVRA